MVNEMGFERAKLHDVCEKIVVGFVGACEPFYTDSTGVPMLRTGNLGEGCLKFDSLKYVTREFHEKQVKSQLIENDLLIARHGDNGKTVLYDGSFPEANCLNIVALRPNNLASPYFLRDLLNSTSMKRFIQTKTGGTTQKVINAGEIKKLNIALPPLPLQQKFVARIREIENLKAKAELVLLEADGLFGATMQDVFGGK